MSVLDDFQRGRNDAAIVAENGFARFRGGGENATVEALERIGGIEGRRHDLRQFDLLAVRIRGNHASIIVDRHRHELAGGIAVLAQRRHLAGAVGVGELGDATGIVQQVDIAERHAIDR